MFESGAVAELAQVMVHAAGETLTGSACLDPAVLDDATVRATARELEAVRRRLDAASCRFLAELHDRQATEDTEALATSRWLARDANLPATATKQRLQTATALRDVLPDVELALRKGRIGFDHARVLAQVTNDRNADAIAAASAALCDLAGLMAFARWRREVHAVAAYADADGGHDPDDLCRNQLHLSGSDDLLLFRGELTGDQAVTFEQLLNATADELFHQYKAEQERFPDAKVPGRATLRALALVELCRQAQGVDLDSTRGPRPDTTVILHTDPAPHDPATPTELNLHHDHDHGNDRGRGCGRPVVTTADGTRLSDQVAEMVLCSTVIRGLWVDTNGVPIAETDAYQPTRAIRRALRHRDGGCTFPGCGARPEWTDAHHVTPWPTGPTALSNLILLCRHHHRAVHRYGWTVTLDNDGWTTWTSPGGTTRWGQRHSTTRAGP